MKMINTKQTSYGFIFGPAEIMRFTRDEKTGRVCLGLITKKYPKGLQIIVTKTGKVRVFDGDKEWLPDD